MSEESKRRGSSLRSNISRESYDNHNDILRMLDRITPEQEQKILKNINLNQYSLKTALLMPAEEYVERNSKKKVGPEIYTKYGADEELYGMYLVIKRRSIKIFKYLWEERGTLWSENHIKYVLRSMAHFSWYEGIQFLFKSSRTQEIYTSMY